MKLSRWGSGFALLITLALGRIDAAELRKDFSPGWYFSTGPRVTDVGEVEVRSYRLISIDVPVSGVKVDFKTGVGYALKGGYRFGEWFTLEAETGFDFNSMRPFSATFPDVTVSNFGFVTNIHASSFEGNLYQIPVMLNAIVTIPIHPRLEPFVGVGFGATTVMFDGRGSFGYTGVSPGPPPFFGSVVTTVENPVSGTFVDTTFSFQALAGVQYAIKDWFAVGFTYQHRFVSNVHFEGVETGGLKSDLFSAILTLRF